MKRSLLFLLTDNHSMTSQTVLLSCKNTVWDTNARGANH